MQNGQCKIQNGFRVDRAGRLLCGLVRPYAVLHFALRRAPRGHFEFRGATARHEATKPIDSPHRLRGTTMATTPLPLMQGTLDLLVLRALASRPLHGYGVATLVHELTGGELAIEDAALYQALHRLDRQGLVDAEWAPSENNRRARYYTLTAAGRKRLREQTATWRRYSRAIDAVLEGA
jgi:transcriptional regulator